MAWDGEYVYFAIPIAGQTERELIKIGITNGRHPNKRIKQLNSPFILKMWGHINTYGDKCIEKKIHKLLKQYRLHGEWFEINLQKLHFLIRENKNILGIHYLQIHLNKKPNRQHFGMPKLYWR